MRTRSTPQRRLVAKWIRERTGTGVGAATLIVWACKRVRPDLQGAVQYPTLEGSAAILATNGPQLLVIQLGRVEFHGSEGSPRPGPMFLEALLAGSFVPRGNTTVPGADVPRSNKNGEAAIDYRGLLPIKDTEAYPVASDGFDSLADVSRLVGAPEGMLPGHLVAELVDGDQQSAVALLSGRMDDEGFVNECLADLDRVVQKEATKAYLALRGTPESLRARIAERLKREVEAASKTTSRTAFRWLLGGGCLTVLGVALTVIDSAVEMLLIAAAGVAVLLVGGGLLDSVKRRQWARRQLELFSTDGPAAHSTGSVTSPWMRSVLPELCVVLIACGSAFTARPLLLAWHERSAVRSKTAEFAGVMTFTAPPGWFRPESKDVGAIRQEVEEGTQNTVQQFSGSKEGGLTITEFDAFRLPHDAGFLVAYRCSVSGAGGNPLDDVWEQASDKIAWGLEQGVIKEVLLNERRTIAGFPAIVNSTLSKDDSQMILQEVWIPEHPNEVVVIMVVFNPSLLPGGADAVWEFMSSVNYGPGSGASDRR